MGLRFSLEHANWLAYVLEPGSEIPPFPGTRFSTDVSATAAQDEKVILGLFLSRLQHNLYSTSQSEAAFGRTVESLLSQLYVASSTSILNTLRFVFSGRPWTALILPSFKDREVDEICTDPQLLQHLIEPFRGHAGLLLQVDEVAQEGQIQPLFNMFPALRSAMTEASKWPGVLIWSSARNAIFLPFASPKRKEIWERGRWIFERLHQTIGQNFSALKHEYAEQFSIGTSSSTPPCHLLQISDVHLGSSEATRRLPRLRQLISDTIEELGPSNVVPIISGDVLNTPDEKLAQQAFDFMEFIAAASDHPPFFVLGNHDIRKQGFGRRDFFLTRDVHPNKVERYRHLGVTLVGFDSCDGGRLASGRVSEAQLIRVGNELDRMRWNECPVLIGIVHHHPLPVDWPSWQHVSALERLFHSIHEPTVAFTNADQFLQFLLHRKFSAVLHGHKHIPRIATCPRTQMPIFGCGSSVGKIETSDNSIRLSLNVVSIDRQTNSLTCRLMMETTPGAGLSNHRDEVFSIRPLGT